MLKRNIKFALTLHGIPIRSIEDLQIHFDGIEILGYYQTGDLQEWLRQRGYMSQYEQVVAIAVQQPRDILRQLHLIFQIEKQKMTDMKQLDQALKRKEKQKLIEQYTSDVVILNQVDCVALTQEELDFLLETEQVGNRTIYLLGKTFFVKDSVTQTTFVGINHPIVILKASERLDTTSKQVKFQNLTLSATSLVRIVGKSIVNCQIDETTIKVRSEFKQLKQVIQLNNTTYNLGELFIRKTHSYKNILVLLGENHNFLPLYREMERCHFLIFFDTRENKVLQTYKTYRNIDNVSTAIEENMFYYIEPNGKNERPSNKYSYPYNLYKIDLDKGFEREEIELGCFPEKTIKSATCIHISLNGEQIYFYGIKRGSGNLEIGYQCHNVSNGQVIKEREIESYPENRFRHNNFFIAHDQVYYFTPHSKSLYTTKGKIVVMQFQGLLGDFVVYNNQLITSIFQSSEETVFDSLVKGDWLYVYDLNSKKQIHQLQVKNGVEKMYIAGELLVIVNYPSGNDQTEGIQLWDLRSLELIHTISFEEIYKHYNWQGVDEDFFYHLDKSCVSLSEDKLFLTIKDLIYVYE